MLVWLKDFMENEGYFFWKRMTCRYYIIHRSELGAGFFSNYYWVLGHVVFARRFGYIPVVDMENYRTLYSEDEPVNGEANAWNYYFENVGSAGLDEAYRSGKYVLARERAMHKYSGRYSKANYRFPDYRKEFENKKGYPEWIRKGMSGKICGQNDWNSYSGNRYEKRSGASASGGDRKLF